MGAADDQQLAEEPTPTSTKATKQVTFKDTHLDQPLAPSTSPPAGGPEDPPIFDPGDSNVEVSEHEDDGFESASDGDDAEQTDGNGQHATPAKRFTGVPRAKNSPVASTPAVRRSSRTPQTRDFFDPTVPAASWHSGAGQSSPDMAAIEDPEATDVRLHACDATLEHLAARAGSLVGRGVIAFAANTPVELPPVPETIHQALSSPEAEAWREAALTELAAINKAEVWDLVPEPPNTNIVSSRWVFARKLNANGEVVCHKARLCARGFTQVEGIDFHETYAPTAKWPSIRMLMALVAARDWHALQIDVVSAYLHATLDEEVFMRQPPGFEVHASAAVRDSDMNQREDVAAVTLDTGGGTGGGTAANMEQRRGTKQVRLVCRLKKSLYGLKQSARNWDADLVSALCEWGLEPCGNDDCLFVHYRGDMVIIVVAVYVDDMIVAGPKLTVLEDFLRWLESRYSCKRLGEAAFLLGIAISRDGSKRVLRMSQAQFVQTVLERFGMQHCIPRFDPAEHDMSANEGAQATKAEAKHSSASLAHCCGCASSHVLTLHSQCAGWHVS